MSDEGWWQVGAALVASPAVSGGGFEVSYVWPGGKRERGSLQQRWHEPFERAGAVRRFSARQGQRSFSGLWYFATSDDHVGYESWLERDRLMVLDADPDVVAVASQPFWLCWEGEKRALRHAPDFFVRRRDGTALVLDVRADDRIGADDAVKFAATARACETVGWQYQRLGALDPVLAANLRWLAGYRHRRHYQRDRVDQLLRAFTRPVPLMEGAATVGDPLGVLPALFHLLWRSDLRTDLLSASLDGGSVVQTCGDVR